MNFNDVLIATAAQTHRAIGRDLRESGAAALDRMPRRPVQDEHDAPPSVMDTLNAALAAAERASRERLAGLLDRLFASEQGAEPISAEERGELARLLVDRGVCGDHEIDFIRVAWSEARQFREQLPTAQDAAAKVRTLAQIHQDKRAVHARIQAATAPLREMLDRLDGEEELRTRTLDRLAAVERGLALSRQGFGAFLDSTHELPRLVPEQRRGASNPSGEPRAVPAVA